MYLPRSSNRMKGRLQLLGSQLKNEPIASFWPRKLELLGNNSILSVSFQLFIMSLPDVWLIGDYSNHSSCLFFRKKNRLLLKLWKELVSLINYSNIPRTYLGENNNVW